MARLFLSGIATVVFWLVCICWYKGVRWQIFALSTFSVLYYISEYCQILIIGPEWFRYFASDVAGPGDFMAPTLCLSVLCSRPRRFVLLLLVSYIIFVMYSEYIEYYGYVTADGQWYQDLLAPYDMLCELFGVAVSFAVVWKYIPPHQTTLVEKFYEAFG
jgi:hypothetical protein